MTAGLTFESAIRLASGVCAPTPSRPLLPEPPPPPPATRLQRPPEPPGAVLTGLSLLDGAEDEVDFGPEAQPVEVHAFKTGPLGTGVYVSDGAGQLLRFIPVQRGRTG